MGNQLTKTFSLYLDVNSSICSYIFGDGIGGDYEEIESGVTGDACIRACIEKKNENDLINGVTVLATGAAGCYCNINMRGTDGDTEYKSCFLHPSTSKSLLLWASKRTFISQVCQKSLHLFFSNYPILLQRKLSSTKTLLRDP